MLGAIFGDIVGSVYERNNVKTTDFPLITSYSRPTDDSILTLAVAKALMETWNVWSDTSMDSSKKDLVIIEALTVNIQSMGRRYPNAGYGGTFRKWLCQNTPLRHNSRQDSRARICRCFRSTSAGICPGDRFPMCR